MIRGEVQAAALASEASPKTWRRLLELLCDPTLDPAQLRAEVAWLRRELRAWPPEVSRPAPTARLVERKFYGGATLPQAMMPRFFATYDDLRPLCRVTREVDLYPLYVEKICTSPRLLLADGTQAVRLSRQFTGKLADRRIGQVGQGDLVGGLCVEWWTCADGCAWTRGDAAGDDLAVSKGARGDDEALDCLASHGEPQRHRLDVRLEVEVKMDDGELEDSQDARLRDFAARGGVYVVPTRIAQAIDLIVEARDRIAAELTS